MKHIFKTILAICFFAGVEHGANAQALNNWPAVNIFDYTQKPVSGDNCVVTVQIQNQGSTTFNGTVGAWVWCTTTPVPMALATGIPVGGTTTLTIAVIAGCGAPNVYWSMGMSVWVYNDPSANLKITNITFTNNGK